MASSGLWSHLADAWPQINKYTTYRFSTATKIQLSNSTQLKLLKIEPFISLTFIFVEMKWKKKNPTT